MKIKIDILLHPKRSEKSKEYDIAIIILETKPPYTDFIRPICLPDLAEKDLFDSNEILYVAGWGWTVGCNLRFHLSLEKTSKLKMANEAINFILLQMLTVQAMSSGMSVLKQFIMMFVADNINKFH